MEKSVQVHHSGEWNPYPLQKYEDFAAVEAFSDGKFLLADLAIEFLLLWSATGSLRKNKK
jgi:hypothetical protein